MAAVVKPVPEEDFGKSVRSKFLSTKRPAACPPEDGVGATLLDVRPEPPAPHKMRVPGMPDGSLQLGTLYFSEPMSDRHGLRQIDSPKGLPKAEGKRQIPYIPVPKAGVESKKCFPWTHRPTGYNNPDQWEEPPVPGVRPTHPVSITGIVALEHKRNFPELQYGRTADPGNPRKSKAPPIKSEYGGWGPKTGAPGRQMHRGVWDSLKPDGLHSGVDVMERFGDATRKPFPEFSQADTRHLTRWHLGAADLDQAKQSRIRVNEPHPTFNSLAASSPLDASQLRPAGLKAGARTHR